MTSTKPFRKSPRDSGRANRPSKLPRHDSAEYVEVLDEFYVPAQIDKLRTLVDGWLDGQGTAPNHAGLDWLIAAFTANYPITLPLPYTYPTLEGNVRFEWPLPPYEASLDIDLTTLQATWHQINLGTDEDIAAMVDLSTTDGWAELCRRIAHLEASST